MKQLDTALPDLPPAAPSTAAELAVAALPRRWRVDSSERTCDDHARSTRGRGYAYAIAALIPAFLYILFAQAMSGSGVVALVCAVAIVLGAWLPTWPSLAPARSTRGGSGGNEWTETLLEKASSGGQRATRAAT